MRTRCGASVEQPAIARRAPRGRARSGTARGSAARRGSAATSATTSRRRCRPARRGRRASRATPRRAARPHPTIPPPTMTTSQVSSASGSRSARRPVERRRRRRCASSTVSVIGRQAAGRREIRHSSQPVPTISTTIASGVWKTTSWTAVGSRLVSDGGAEDDRDDGDGHEEDLAPARLTAGAPRLSHGRPPAGCRSGRRGPCRRSAAPRRVSSPVLGRWKVTVRSARTAGSDGSPLERSTAVGVSTATTGTPAARAWPMSSTAERIGSRSAPADAGPEQRVDDDRRLLDALAEDRDVAGDRRVDLGDPGVARDPVPVPGRRGAPWAARRRRRARRSPRRRRARAGEPRRTRRRRCCRGRTG